MPKYIDKRDFSFNRITTNFAAEATSVSDDLPGNHRVNVERVNPFTGSAEQLRSVNAGSAFAAMPGFGPTAQSLIEMAQEHLRVTAPAIGFGPGERRRVRSRPERQRDEHGRACGQPPAAISRDSPSSRWSEPCCSGQGGAVQTVTGTSVGCRRVGDPAARGTGSGSQRRRAEHTAEPEKTHRRVVAEEYVLPAWIFQPTSRRCWVGLRSRRSPPCSEAGAVRRVPSRRIWFCSTWARRHASLGTSSSAWPNLESQYVILVEADSQTADRENPEVLYAQQSSSEIVARGKVWTHNPGTNGERQLVEFPRPLTEYPIDPLPGNLPETFPFPWVDGVNLTIGNNAVAVIGNTLDFAQRQARRRDAHLRPGRAGG
jgi:hypothetical protein